MKRASKIYRIIITGTKIRVAVPMTVVTRGTTTMTNLNSQKEYKGEGADWNAFAQLPGHALPQIRWPGGDILWAERSQYGALHRTVTQERSRGPRIRGIIEAWSKSQHGGQFHIVASDKPQPKSRVRSYKGLLPRDCRRQAKMALQAEFPVTANTSVIFGSFLVASNPLAPCLFRLLGDAPRSFGVFSCREDLMSSECLEKIRSCYREDHGIWRWDPTLLIPVACLGRASLFFLQGLASSSSLQLVVYLPISQMKDYLGNAKEVTKAFE